MTATCSSTGRRLLSVVTDEGTAMSEATLCTVHHAVPELREHAEGWAEAAEDLTGPIVWLDSTENNAVSCVECNIEDEAGLLEASWAAHAHAARVEMLGKEHA